jgi:hypothetical protein
MDAGFSPGASAQPQKASHPIDELMRIVGERQPDAPPSRQPEATTFPDSRRRPKGRGAVASRLRVSRFIVASWSGPWRGSVGLSFQDFPIT